MISYIVMRTYFKVHMYIYKILIRKAKQINSKIMLLN